MRHLLVIHSDTAARNLLCQRLQTERHQVTAHSDAREATASFGAGVVAALLEYGLPDHDTLQVLRALRAIDQAPPIIVLTVPSEHVTALLREGAYFCTRAPLNVDEVALLIERSIRSSSHNAHSKIAPETEPGIADLIGESSETRDAASQQPPALFRLPAQGIDFRELEREIVAQALELANGNQTRAALLLHMTRDQIRYRMAKFGINDLPTAWHSREA